MRSNCEMDPELGDSDAGTFGTTRLEVTREGADFGNRRFADKFKPQSGAAVGAAQVTRPLQYLPFVVLRLRHSNFTS